MTEKRTGDIIKKSPANKTAPQKSSGSIKKVAGKGKPTKTRKPHLTLNPPKKAAGKIPLSGSIEASPDGTAAVSASVPAVKSKKNWILSGFDYALFTIVIILLAFGLIMMFSASYATAYSATGDSLFYVKRQVIFAIGGIVIMLILSSIDYHIFRSKAIVFLIVGVSTVLMLLVKIMGTTQGGSERWLQIGEITFQPSEILKFAVIVLFAYLTEKKFDHIREFKKGFMPFALFLGFSCLLLMLQPHLSGTIIVFAIGLTMMFVALG